MSALISFLATDPDNEVINNLSGSGLGFYGYGGYSTSVQVGQYQNNTYITNATGTATNAIKANNVMWTDPASGEISGGTMLYLRQISNYLATLNIRFTNDTPVKTQNAQLRIYDRVDIDNPPSGVVAKVAIICHPWGTEAPDGSGDITWRQPGGSGTIVTFNDFPATTSPGSGGLSPSGTNTVDIQHDFFICLSTMPTQIGSSLFALSFSLEYL